jgi:hypothetical protein
MDRGLAQPMASANEGVRKKIMPRELWPTIPNWGLQRANFSACR